MPPSINRIKVSDPIVVGKDILELLSSAMYVDPLAVYREYVQNAADSIDEAESNGLFPNGDTPKIEITINPEERWARIRDSGSGVPKASFIRTLTAIGASRKRGTRARGFRGVGRLAGLAYCQEMVLRTKSQNDQVVSVMHWDCRRLRELLRDPADLDLNQIIPEIVSTETLPPKGYPDRFFDVDLLNVSRFKNDLLMNDDALSQYLSQVGPVPFSPEFSYGRDIVSFLSNHCGIKSYKIVVNGKPAYRPYRNSYEIRPKVHSKFDRVEFYTIDGVSSGTDAAGWILHGDYSGAIPDRHGIRGLRLRIGNIQVGDPRILDGVFPESRFNSWAVGECHVISPRVVPNARRDDFEQNNHYSNLLGHLVPKAKAISKACRDMSSERTRQRREAIAKANGTQGTGVDWSKTKEFFTKNGSSERYLSG
jgi:molecular chaperone HtpG